MDFWKNAGFKKLSKEEIEAKEAIDLEKFTASSAEREERRLALKEKQEIEKFKKEVDKKAHADFLNKKRQQAWRDREKVKKSQDDLRRQEIITIDDPEDVDSVVSSLPIAIIAPKRPDWYSPFYWNDIVHALALENYNSRKAVALLKKKFAHDGRFDQLSFSTIEGWFHRTISEDGARNVLWVEKILQKVRARESMFSRPSGKEGILNTYPEIGVKIVKMLKAIRNAGAIVNSSICRSVIVGILEVELPAILSKNGGHFKVSLTWVRCFVNRNLSWSFRAPTTAAQKLPDDWEEQGELLIYRLAYYIRMYSIHPSRVINADQTGVVLIPSGDDRTYDDCGTKEVKVIGGEEKRACTAVVGSTSSGRLLPLQSVWKGSTVKSLPDQASRASSEAVGFHYTLNKKNHWSSLSTTKEYFKLIIEPYLQATLDDERKVDPTLDENYRPYFVFLIDCWKIHKSKDFLEWIKATYPTALILFIPARCTGKFQPADLILQRALKHEIRRQFNSKMAAKVKEHLALERKIEDFKFDTTLGFLRNLMPELLLAAYEYVAANQEFVLASWRKAKAKSVNLLSAWERSIQDKAVELYQASKLFPTREVHSETESSAAAGNQNAIVPEGIEISVDAFPNADSDEVSSDELIAKLLQSDDFHAIIEDPEDSDSDSDYEN
jgi:hypothetical protein